MTNQYVTKRSKSALSTFYVKNKLRQGQLPVGNKIRPISTYYTILDNLLCIRKNRYASDLLKIELMHHCKRLDKLLSRLNIRVGTD
jgi:hypothetical protein